MSTQEESQKPSVQPNVDVGEEEKQPGLGEDNKSEIVNGSVPESNANKLQSTEVMSPGGSKEVGMSSSDKEIHSIEGVQQPIVDDKQPLIAYKRPENIDNKQPKSKLVDIQGLTQGVVAITVAGKTFSDYQHAQITSFEQLGLRKELIEACALAHFTHPSKIQANALPLILKKDEKSGKYPHFIGQAKHGSGKTATFVLAMLQRLDEHSGKLQCLCLCHTRELAIQTYEVIKLLSSRMPDVNVFLAVPGEMFPHRWQHQIVVGTPGSILKLIINPTNNYFDSFEKFLLDFKMLVIDEADELLRLWDNPMQSKGYSYMRGRANMRGGERGRGRGRGRGHSDIEDSSLTDQTRKIINLIENHSRPDRHAQMQTLLFSATFPDAVRSLANKIAPNAISISVTNKDVKLDNVKNYSIECFDEKDKLNILTKILAMVNVGQMIIFVNSIRKAAELFASLDNEKVNVRCSVLVGKMDPEKRDKTMSDFRVGNTNVLIASNVIARGIDVPAVKVVLNYEIPIELNSKGTGDSETFMHRVGRAGRFGTKGACINLVDDRQSAQRLDSIRKTYQIDMKRFESRNWKDLTQELEAWVGVGAIDLKGQDLPADKHESQLHLQPQSQPQSQSQPQLQPQSQPQSQPSQPQPPQPKPAENKFDEENLRKRAIIEQETF